MDPSLDELPAGAIVPRASILDISDRLGPDGKLVWDVPAGIWTILRIGHTPTGAVNAPAPDSGRGLECDKLDRAGMDAHWAGGIAPVLAELGPLAGKVLHNLLIDSYEVGHQNWSASFRAEFERRRGYDPLLYLPAMTGRVVRAARSPSGSCGTCGADRGPLRRELLRLLRRAVPRNGLIASIEPYDGPFEGLQVARDADVPMGEFWVGGGGATPASWQRRSRTSAADDRGAESFTAEPRVGAGSTIRTRSRRSAT